MYDFNINTDYLASYMPPPGAVEAPPETPAAAPTEAPPPDQTPIYTPDGQISGEWAAAMAYTATADYGALPYGEFMDPHQGTYDAAAAAGLDQEGVDMMKTMAMQGTLDRMDGINRSVGEEIVARLQMGAVDNGLAKTLMSQIIDPDANILQIGDHTCVAATNQKAMAQDRPGLYFITGADLVNAGQGNLPNGEQVFVSEANQTLLNDLGVTGAQRVDAAFQAALMDHANGADSYDLGTDTSTREDGRTYVGLNRAQATELNQDVLEAPTLDASNILADFEARSMNPQYIDLGMWGGGGFELPPPPLGQVIGEHLAAAQRQGFPGVFVPVAADSGALHMVLVKNINPATNSVTVSDASGASRQVPYHDFLNTIALNDGDIGQLRNQTVSGASSAGGRQPVVRSTSTATGGP